MVYSSGRLYNYIRPPPGMEAEQYFNTEHLITFMEESMPKSNLTFKLFLAAFAFLAFISCPAFAETMGTYTTDSLYFLLGTDEVFIGGTSDGDTLASIDFSFYFESQYISDHSIGEIGSANATFTFNFDSLEYVGFDMSENWTGTNADLNIDTSSSTITRLTTVTLTLSNGEVTPPSSPTVFATLYFEAKVQSGENQNDLIFETGTADNQVIAGDYYRPTSGSLTDGYIDINSYEIYFKIPDDLEFTDGPLGQEITVPVLWKTNFYTRALALYIVYDTAKLVPTDYLIYNEEEEWPGFSHCYTGDTLYFFGISSYGVHADVHDDYDTLLTWTMRLRYDCSAWDGDSAAFTICETPTIIAVHIAEDDVTLSENYESNYILVDRYIDSLSIRSVESISKTDSTGSFMIRMKNNFKAGDTTNSMLINMDLGNDLKSVSVNTVSEDDSLAFGYQTNTPPGGPLELQAYQYYDNSKANYFIPHDTFTDLVEVYFTYDSLIGYEPDYDDRYYPILFENIYDSEDTAVVYDTTRSVKCDVASGRLGWISDSIEILQAEFSTTSASTSSGIVYDYLKLRNNFEVAKCTVYVTVPANWTIVCPSTYNGFTSSKISNQSYKFYLSSGTKAANGDNYTNIAKIYYMPPWTGQCQINYTTPNINGYTVFDTNDSLNFVSEVQGTVGANPCGTVPYPCGDGPEREGNEYAQEDLMPDRFNLHPNRPNPFNPTTVIAYDIPTPSHVTIDIINILGQRIITLVDEEKAAGSHEVIWNATDENGVRVATGIYLYNMRAGEFTQTRKMMLMK